MLLKMYKYDMKMVSTKLLIIHAAVLILGLISVFTGKVSSAKEMGTPINIMSGIFIICFFITAIIAVIMTHIVLILRFHNRMFSNQGYITNTLPLTTDQHMLSHLLAYITWIAIDAAVFCMIAFSIPVFDGRIGELIKVVSAIAAENGTYIPKVILFAVVSLISSGIFMAGLAYFATSIGNLANVHKVITAFAAYVGGMIASLIILSLVSSSILYSTWIFKTNRDIEGVFGGGYLNLIAVAGIGVLFYFIARTIINKRLNLG